MARTTSEKRKISDQAVSKATGRSWSDWHRILKEAERQSGNDRWPHKRIASYLKDNFSLSAWWCQMVCSSYENFESRRESGETAAAGFEIGVRKTISAPKMTVWKLLTGPRGLKLWLGDTPGFKLIKGQKYRTSEGVSGEIRVVEVMDHLRLTWQPSDWPNPTTLQIRVIPRGKEKTTIGFHHEKLSDAVVREQMRSHWKKVLEIVKTYLEKPEATL
jgi:uncharacterized protein YndB with AHSA1/START domain